MNENTSVGIAEQLQVSSHSPTDGSVDMPKFIVKTESKFSNVYVVSAPDAKTAVNWVLDSQNTPSFIQCHLGERAVHVERTEFTNPVQAKSKYPDHF